MSIKISLPCLSLVSLRLSLYKNWRYMTFFLFIYSPLSLSTWSLVEIPHPDTFTIVFGHHYICVSPRLNCELPEGKSGIRHPQSLVLYLVCNRSDSQDYWMSELLYSFPGLPLGFYLYAATADCFQVGLSSYLDPKLEVGWRLLQKKQKTKPEPPNWALDQELTWEVGAPGSWGCTFVQTLWSCSSACTAVESSPYYTLYHS